MVFKVRIPFIICLVLSIGILSGFLLSAKTIQPEVIEVTKVIERHFNNTEVHVVDTKTPVIVTEIEYVEKPIYLPQPLRHFNTLAELKSWLAKDKTNLKEYELGGYDCEDFAYTLQANAFQDGFILSIQIEKGINYDHFVNTALIGNKIYRIEPQTDKVTLKNYCD